MTEKEVQDILAEEMSNKPTREALAAAHNRIALQILSGLANPGVNDIAWGVLKDAAHLKSRLCLYLGFLTNKLIHTDEDLLREVMFLYECCVRIMDYLNNFYAGLDSEKFKKAWPQETVLGVRNGLAEKHQKLTRQFAVCKTILFNQQDLHLIDQICTWSILAILGFSSFEKFQEEFNKAAALLRKYKTELLSPSA